MVGFHMVIWIAGLQTISPSLYEAARVEGASWWQICARVVMPLAGPVLATAAILKFLVIYDQYLWPMKVAQQESCRSVMVGLP